MHPIKYGSHHHLQQQQQFMADDNDSSSSSVFFIPSPQQQQQQSVFPYPVNSQYEDRQCSGNNKVSQSKNERSKNLDHKYRLFGELEAIYGHGGEAAQAGSGSALTGENSPANVATSMPLTEFHGHNVGANGGVGNGSESTSIVKEASLRNKIQKKINRKTKMEEMSSMVVFFGSLVKQVIDHQEYLHRRFLEVIERMDKERSVKDESWRQQEVERRNREAIARAHEQALASSREALIVSYLEKITGESINLPQRTPLLVQPESTVVKADNNSRYPIPEVEALIQVRCNFQSKFREPGLKGALWEDESSLMSSFGYQRSAKRCKEKWENINKYFRKSKENRKKRSQQSKTCSYFDQLDQVYSRIPINTDIEMQKQGDSDLLEPYIPQGVDVNRSLKVSGMNSPKLDFDGTVGDKQGSNVKDNKSRGNYLENDGDEQEDDGNDSDEENEN
ncbi:putative cytochrome P450 [Hibiscus syriacus]|uniref:Cytochrome P450 n=1 Tax=Hibiscus syriacus TaxID=106335 RepID=A0A6A2YEL5_HIBSY|nr:putative cytochrome P450 [Hibiscus syriacus]